MSTFRSSKLYRTVLPSVGIAALILFAMPYALYSLQSGLAGLTTGDAITSRFFATGHTLGNQAVFGHMFLGGFLTVFIPVQLWGAARRRVPGLHRWNGRLLCLFAVLTGTGGLTYILTRGTIGGVWMDAGFGLYGVLLVLCALQTVRYARAGRFTDHRRWALRLFVLSMGSWLYRVHYGIWYAFTGGYASTPTFEGTFDLIQNVAFYLPYLVALEMWMRRPKRTVSA